MLIPTQTRNGTAQRTDQAEQRAFGKPRRFIYTFSTLIRPPSLKSGMEREMNEEAGQVPLAERDHARCKVEGVAVHVFAPECERADVSVGGKGEGGEKMRQNCLYAIQGCPFF